MSYDNLYTRRGDRFQKNPISKRGVITFGSGYYVGRVYRNEDGSYEPYDSESPTFKEKERAEEWFNDKSI